MDFLSGFLLNNFNVDNLYMPLFYRMQYALRFEIGEPSINTNKKVYIDNVYLKSLILFKEVFKCLNLILVQHFITKNIRYLNLNSSFLD